MAKRAALLLFVLILGASPSLGQNNVVARCDALAAETIALDAIDTALAIDACAQAVAADPANPQSLHQYARALEAAGRLDDARRLYEWAAEDRYTPAVAALQRLAGIGAGGPDWAPGAREEVADAAAALSGALRRYLNTLPPDPADPLTILAEVGPTPEALALWVAENTRLVAYAGSLRGPLGVLTDRAGNSLDRALLLAELLMSAGEEVQIARASLDATAAEALYGATQRVVPVPSLRALSRDELLALFADPRIPPALIESAVDQMLAARSEIATIVPEQTDVLFRALASETAAATATGEVAAREAALAALTDHFWVQLRRGGAWIDLDPNATAVGTNVAVETFQPGSVPDDLRHAVTVRVILELQDTAGRREEQLLEQTWFTADRPAEALVLSHAFAGLQAIDQLLGVPDIGDRVLALMDAETAWTPMLRSADQLVVDRLFTRDGVVREANLGVFAGAGAAMGGLFAELGAILDGEEKPPETAIPTAEWIEIEVRAPGAEPRIERRTIFDLVGPAARASGTMVEIGPDLLTQRALRLVGPTDIFVFAAGVSDVALERASVSAVVALADGIRVVASTEVFPPISEIPEPQRVPVALLQYANERLADGVNPPVAAPNVVFVHERFDWDGANATRSIEFDIALNPVGAGFAESLRQGIADTVIEAAIAGDDGTANAAAIHLDDIAAGRNWTLVTPGDIAPRGTDDDFRARLRADLDAGYLVVAPDGAGSGMAWWRIDPATGRALGMLPSGGGAVVTEYALMAVEGAATGACFVGIGMAMARIIGAPTSLRKAAGLCLLAGGIGAAGVGIAGGVALVGSVFILLVAAATGP